jgi:DNA modification methylase
VIDPFLGSGSTLIAAETAGRVCRGIELDPLYVDVIVRRYEAATGRCQSNDVSPRSAPRLAQVAVYAARARHSPNAAKRLCL